MGLNLEVLWRAARVGKIALVVGGGLASLNAAIRLPAIFGDHMVVQRSRPVAVWGWADPGETVTVALAGRSATATAAPDGKWQARLGPLVASGTGQEMTISGTNRIVLHDVLIGDVWVCSGQSNMELQLNRTYGARSEIPRANEPGLRLFRVQNVIRLAPEDDCRGKWEVCSPESAPEFSAVAYYFGREIGAVEKVPVGLVSTYWGGTPAQAWTSADALAADPALAHYAVNIRSIAGSLEKLKQEYATKTLPKWKQQYAEWHGKYGAAYEAAAAEFNRPPPDERPSGYLVPFQPKPPVQPRRPGEDPNLPTVLFNGMVHPLVPFGITGVIWYQGESNAGAAKEYEKLFPAMIADWRRRWGQGDFPFLFVQLAAYKSGNEKWADLRDAQLKTLAYPMTGMAVAIDIGDPRDIHPKDKRDVGHRLAVAARHIAYGEDVPYSGPIYDTMAVEDGAIRVSFRQVDGGLKIRQSPLEALAGAAASPNLEGFELAGSDHTFMPAQATIVGDQVVVRSASVPHPEAVRYAWAAFPNPTPNLYNQADLPASPFSSRSGH